MEVNIILAKRTASDYFWGICGEGMGQEYDHYFFIIIYGKIGKRKTKTQTKSCLYNIHSYFLPSLLTESCESESCSVVSDSLGPHGLSPWSSSVQNTGVGSLSLLQGIFPTQGSNQVSRIAGGFFTS